MNKIEEQAKDFAGEFTSCCEQDCLYSGFVADELIEELKKLKRK